MNKCPKCNSDVNPDDKRCLKCGADLTATNNEETNKSNPQDSLDVPERLQEYTKIMLDTEKKPNKKPVALIVILSILTVIILAVVGMFATKMLYVEDGTLHFSNIFSSEQQEKLPVLNKDGETQTDPDGNVIYEEAVTDPNGNIVTDEDGNIIYNRPVTDENGNVIIDEDGNIKYEEATDPERQETVPTENKTDAPSEKVTESKTDDKTDSPTEKATEKTTEKETEKPSSSQTSKTVQINGEDYNVGDTVIYTVKLSDIAKPVCGISVQINYNSSMLKIDEDGLNFPELGAPVYNIDLTDQMLFNAVDINGYDFSKENILVEIPFVIQESSSTASEISTEILDIIDYNSQTLEVTTITEEVKKK